MKILFVLILVSLLFASCTPDQVKLSLEQDLEKLTRELSEGTESIGDAFSKVFTGLDRQMLDQLGALGDEVTVPEFIIETDEKGQVYTLRNKNNPEWPGITVIPDCNGKWKFQLKPLDVIRFDVIPAAGD